MIASTGFWGVVNYALDDVGNRVTVDRGPGQGTYTMSAVTPNPADHQMNQYTTTPRGQNVYDARGSLKVQAAGVTGQVQYAYDYRAAMTTAQKSGMVASYITDALGRRVQKTVNNVITRYYYFGFQVVEEQDAGGATAATYVYGNYIDEVLNMRRGGVDTYYHTDDMFNVVRLTNASGEVVERYDYSDYGAPITYHSGTIDLLGGSSAAGNPYLFNGRNYDRETGLYYYRTRYMDPWMGRFTTRDTIGVWGDEGSLGNGFIAFGGNSASFVDPFGAKCEVSGRWIKAPSKSNMGVTINISSVVPLELKPRMFGLTVLRVSGTATIYAAFSAECKLTCTDPCGNVTINSTQVSLNSIASVDWQFEIKYGGKIGTLINSAKLAKKLNSIQEINQKVAEIEKKARSVDLKALCGILLVLLD